MADDIDDRFAHLIRELDGAQITAAAIEGAVHDLAAHLERVLLELREREYNAVGYEVEEVQLEIKMAEFALGKLSRMFDTLAAIEAGRGDSGA